MTAISAHDLSFVTAGGDVLFDSLHLELPRDRHGLVGRNGSGKTLLARLLGGELTASRGTVVRHVPTSVLPQSLPRGRSSLADVLGLGRKLAALARIEAGSVEIADFEQLGDDWEFAARWRQWLVEAGLPDDLERSAAHLSGGELTRAHLLRLFAASSHYLILDEPSNHLDRHARSWLRQRLRAHAGGALIVSHDRELLDDVAAIHELSATGLKHYGGNYTLYRSSRDEEQHAAQRDLELARRQFKATQRERERAVQKQLTRQQRARRSDANLPRLLIGTRQGQAEQSLGRLRNAHERRVEASRAHRDRAVTRVEQRARHRIDIPAPTERRGIAVHLQDLVLPFGHPQPLSLVLRMGQRMHVVGRNGSGKSSLLDVLAGRAAPRAGTVRVGARLLLIDQHFSLIDPNLSALENLATMAPARPQDHRTLLAGIGLAGDRAMSSAGTLSGGEKVRLALLALDAKPEPSDLLLLDEPDNHLDLEAKELLEEALRHYTGTLLLVSHDPVFVERVGVGDVLCLDDGRR